MSIAGLSSHQSVVSKSVRAIQDRLNLAAGECDVIVSVTEGVQAGASRRMRAARLTMGSGEGDDVVVLDPAAEAGQASVRFSRSVFGPLAEVTAAGSITVGGAALKAGETLSSQTLPLRIGIAGTQVSVRRPSLADLDPSAIRARPDAVLTLALLALVLLVLGGLAWSLWSERSSTDVIVSDGTRLAVAAVPAASARDWMTETRGQIGLAGLSETLNVEAMPGGMLRVAGVVANPELASFREVQGWYDSQADAPAIVWAVERRVGWIDMPPIGMIRLSEPRAVVLNTGTVIALGDPLVDGWRLEAVEADSIELARGAERQVVPLGEEGE